MNLKKEWGLVTAIKSKEASWKPALGNLYNG